MEESYEETDNTQLNAFLHTLNYWERSSDIPEEIQPFFDFSYLVMDSYQQLESTAADQTQEIKYLKTKLEQTARKNTELMEEQLTLEDEIQMLKDNSNTLKKTIADYAGQIESLHETLIDCQEEVNKLTEENDQVKYELEKCKNQRRIDVNSSNMNFDDDYKALQINYNELFDSVQEYQSQLMDERSKVLILTGKINEMERVIGRLNDEVGRKNDEKIQDIIETPKTKVEIRVEQITIACQTDPIVRPAENIKSPVNIRDELEKSIKRDDIIENAEVFKFFRTFIPEKDFYEQKPDNKCQIETGKVMKIKDQLESSQELHFKIPQIPPAKPKTHTRILRRCNSLITQNETDKTRELKLYELKESIENLKNRFERKMKNERQRTSGTQTDLKCASASTQTNDNRLKSVGFDEKTNENLAFSTPVRANFKSSPNIYSEKNKRFATLINPSYHVKTPSPIKSRNLNQSSFDVNFTTPKRADFSMTKKLLSKQSNSPHTPKGPYPSPIVPRSPASYLLSLEKFKQAYNRHHSLTDTGVDASTQTLPAFVCIVGGKTKSNKKNKSLPKKNFILTPCVWFPKLCTLIRQTFVKDEDIGEVADDILGLTCSPSRENLTNGSVDDPTMVTARCRLETSDVFIDFDGRENRREIVGYLKNIVKVAHNKKVKRRR